MNLLLDTHALLWWLADAPELSTNARHLIANPDNQVHVSAVSGWEIGIKQALGKLEVDTEELAGAVREGGFEALPVSFEHGLRAGALPSHHRDPFDRMLIAQAQAEGLTIVTRDPAFSAYDVTCAW